MVAILRLKPDTPVLAIVAFHGRFTVEHRHDDLAVARDALRPHHDQIAVRDRCLNHRIALHAQHERIGDARHKGRGQHELAFEVLLGR